MVSLLNGSPTVMQFLYALVIVALIIAADRRDKRRFEIMSAAQERLATEIAETKQAVTDLRTRVATNAEAMQAQIDALKAAAADGDDEAITAAADALDSLQTELAAIGAPAAADEPAETVEAGNGADSLPAGEDSVEA